MKVDDNVVVNPKTFVKLIRDHLVENSTPKTVGCLEEQKLTLRSPGSKDYIPPDIWNHYYSTYFTNGVFAMNRDALSALIAVKDVAWVIPINEIFVRGKF